MSLQPREEGVSGSLCVPLDDVMSLQSLGLQCLQGWESRRQAVWTEWKVALSSRIVRCEELPTRHPSPTRK